MSGYITISRRLFKHHFWTERREFSLAEAWIDMIQAAAWQDGRQLVKGKFIDVKRGELLASLRYLQQRWGWGSPNRVARVLEMLQKENMISLENETVAQRITICKYESYNTPRTENGTETEHRRNTDGTETEHRRNKENNNNKINKINKINKETTPTQAGGEIFQKLSNRVGPVTAKICIEGNVGQLVGDEKRPQLLRWLEHKFTKGQPIITTQVLFAIVQQFQANDLETLTNSITESIGGDYARLVISKPKATDKKPVFPNYWKPGIEVELNLTPEQTNEYYRHLIGLRWYKTTIQGQPYWNRPAADNAARTGEGTISKTLQQT
jgi:hypothetical protein